LRRAASSRSAAGASGRGLRGSAAAASTHNVAFAVRSSENTVNKELFDKGLQTRREVLGAEHVDAAIRNADDFNRPMQELVTQYCWGEVWNRPGLDRRTRSLLNLAMLTALNRPHELKLHVRGALNNGVTKDEVREVLLQAAIYCGVPAAIDGFRVAREAFKEAGV
jgi:4-carboxymuconolactone decarboxylase